MIGVRRFAVEVNECKIYATQQGIQWWSDFRRGQNARCKTIKSSIGGDLVQVACDSQDHARWLTGHMVEHCGVPRSALKVVTS